MQGVINSATGRFKVDAEAHPPSRVLAGSDVERVLALELVRRRVWEDFVREEKGLGASSLPEQ